jgi:hypothetical protein
LGRSATAKNTYSLGILRKYMLNVGLRYSGKKEINKNKEEKE